MKRVNYPVKEVKPGVWRVEEFNLGTMYVVRGSERGLVIDTGTGVGDFKGLVEELLSTPYDVVLTHGHGDHAGGTHQFPYVYVHRSDVKMAAGANLASRRDYAMRIHDTYPETAALFDPADMTEDGKPTFLPMADGHVFDLGDKKLEVFACPGHTPGCIDILDREDKVLFSGDNHQHLELVMMPGDDRKAVIAKWLRGVRKAQKLRDEGAYDLLCGGHEELEIDLLEDLIACGEGILKDKIKPQYKKVHIFEAPFASFGRVNIMYLGQGRQYRYELMRPDEIVAARDKCPVAFLPIGPLEWHGPAMPFGTDALQAAAVAEGAVKKLGVGVLLPTLYFGTERARTPDILRNIGFEGDEYIIGQDFPKNTIPSLYAREEVFAATVSEYIRMLEKQGFKLIVLVNGHGADGQNASLDRLMRQFNGESKTAKVIVPGFFAPLNKKDGVNMGHATVLETSIMMYLTNSVDLSKLPPKEVPLKNTDWGITDGATYIGKANREGTVVGDPRNSTAERGKKYIENAIGLLVTAVETALLELKD